MADANVGDTSEQRWALLVEVGVVRIRSLPGGEVEVTEEDDGIEEVYVLDADEAAQLIQPIVDADEAEQLIHRFTGPAPPPPVGGVTWTGRDHQRAFESGSLIQQVDALRSLYHSAGPPHARAAQLDRFEQVVGRHLACSLGVDYRTARDRVRRIASGQPPPPAVVLPDRRVELADLEQPPTLGRLRAVGVFAVERALAVGESLDGPSMLAEPGPWLAYSAYDEGYDELPLLAVHHRHLGRVAELCLTATRVGRRLPINAASMAMADGALRHDADYLELLAETSTSVVGHRGVILWLGGDGAAIVRAAILDDRAVLVVVEDVHCFKEPLF
jgi:hypothetical protein